MISKYSSLLYSFILLVVSVIGILNIYLYIQQPGMIFYPVKEVDVTPKEWELEYTALKLKLPDGQNIAAWYLPHPQAEKTVLFFHGNGGNMSHRGDSLYIFHKLKLNSLIIDYPGYGESEGSPSEKNLYDSADAAWQYLMTEKKTKAEKIIIFGRSLGGAVAADLASRVNAGGLILESTFSSVRDMVSILFPGVSNLIYLRYSFDTLNKIKKIKSPVLVIHSPGDEVIPFVLGKKVFDSIESEKEFLQIKGGHNDGFMQSISSYMKILRNFSLSI
ncbi:MAG: alpha/beta hydrolase [Gammaproteobacteria bacterium]|nr:alpha/beta hydrolase [Gammaproteobacteria bacterium]